MNRWLQSFASFCEFTASGLSNCCASSSSINNAQAGIRVCNAQKSPQSKFGLSKTLSKQAARHSDSESAHIQHFQPAYKAGVSDGLERNLGAGGGDEELAIHRAARRGTVELLRFILRYCKRGTSAAAPHSAQRWLKFELRARVAATHVSHQLAAFIQRFHVSTIDDRRSDN
jgi:hypothetical protein